MIITTGGRTVSRAIAKLLYQQKYPHSILQGHRSRLIVRLTTT